MANVWHERLPLGSPLDGRVSHLTPRWTWANSAPAKEFGTALNGE
jgi:hypothetical protein